MTAVTSVKIEKMKSEDNSSNLKLHMRIRKHSANLFQQIRRSELLRKHSANLSQLQQEDTKQPTFGICFDVDGVLAHGTLSIPAAVKAFRKLKDEKGQIKIPVVFVTNSLSRRADRAAQISNWMGVKVHPEQVILAPTPLEMFTKLHDKFCVIIGQGKISEIAKDLGFKNTCSIEEVAEAYPLLDVVDHSHRQKIAQEGYAEKNFPRVEAVILLGEPKHWETPLQLIVDLLRTDGKPDEPPKKPPKKHIPVVACNMDLEFQDRASMPRYGHGAFIYCLECLYKKITGNDLTYTALIGKPSEITYRYAEHALTRESKRLGCTEPLKAMYLVGDTPEVDIYGSNLYQRYIDRLNIRRLKEFKDVAKEEDSPLELIDPVLPESRNVPSTVQFYPQSVNTIEGVLVCTGVYKRGTELGTDDPEKQSRGHRDFTYKGEMYKPSQLFENVDEAIGYILEKENYY